MNVTPDWLPKILIFLTNALVIMETLKIWDDGWQVFPTARGASIEFMTDEPHNINTRCQSLQSPTGSLIKYWNTRKTICMFWMVGWFDAVINFDWPDTGLNNWSETKDTHPISARTTQASSLWPWHATCTLLHSALIKCSSRARSVASVDPTFPTSPQININYSQLLSISVAPTSQVS